MIAERTRRLRRVVALAAAGLVMAGCGGGGSPPPTNELRFKTEDFVIRVSPETKPTRALEPIYWRVMVHDVKSGLPIQGGEGRIFGTNRDRKTVSNGLAALGLKLLRCLCCQFVGLALGGGSYGCGHRPAKRAVATAATAATPTVTPPAGGGGAAAATAAAAAATITTAAPRQLSAR